MGNIIIVEGVDRVGKTTLCNKLCEELRDIKFNIVKYDSQIIQCKDRQNNYETDKSLLTLSLCKLIDSTIIFDRLHISDYVYGIVQRNYDYLKANKNFTKIEKYANDNFNVILIFVKPTDLFKSSEEHGANLILHEKWFEKCFLKSKIKNKFSCDYNTLDDAVKFIDNTIQRGNKNAT